MNRVRVVPRDSQAREAMRPFFPASQWKQPSWSQDRFSIVVPEARRLETIELCIKALGAEVEVVEAALARARAVAKAALVK
jgi:hypothetical protein